MSYDLSDVNNRGLKRKEKWNGQQASVEHVIEVEKLE